MASLAQLHAKILVSETPGNCVSVKKIHLVGERVKLNTTDYSSGFPRLLESPGFFFLKIPGPGKSWKITLVLEIKA